LPGAEVDLIVPRKSGNESPKRKKKKKKKN
jgi:hypothetical protein